jgi:hypothetical protein
MMAKSFGVPSRRVIKKSEVREAIREMLDTPGPYLLEVGEGGRCTRARAVPCCVLSPLAV